MKNLLIVAMLLTMTGCTKDSPINTFHIGKFHVKKDTEDSGTDYSKPQGTTVYDPSECVGAVVNGVCHGGIVPNKAVHPVCHGEMLNGHCTGPVN